MRVLYSLDVDESWGDTQTLSLCLTWIPLHSDINRCPKNLSRELLTLISTLKTVNPDPSLKIQVFLTVIQSEDVGYFVLNVELLLYGFAAVERFVEHTVGRGAFARAQLNLTIREAT